LVSGGGDQGPEQAGVVAGLGMPLHGRRVWPPTTSIVARALERA
jgi:hypothetical protein